jgi:hypothetical protein
VFRVAVVVFFFVCLFLFLFLFFLNRYLEELSKAKAVPNGYVLKNIAIYITDIFKVFGLISDGVENDTDYGFPVSDAGGAEVVDKVEIKMILFQFFSLFLTMVYENN